MPSPRRIVPNPRARGLLAVLAASVAAACTSAGPGAGAGSAGTDAGSAVTYRSHVAPLVEEHCAGCHRAGGSAPFALTSFAEVKSLAPVCLASMVARRMPPWLPSPDCHPLQGSRRLPQDAIDRFGAWVSAGMPEGTGDVARSPARPVARALVPNVIATIPVEYISPEVDDDYRCFVLPAEFPATVYATGFDVESGSARVHHVLVYSLAGDALTKARAADGRDGKPGYTCFSGVVPGVNARATSNLSEALPPLLGGWVPGSEPTLHADGVGQRIKAGSRLVVQMHYSALGGKPAPDHTRIRVETTREAPAQLVDVRPLVNLDIPTPAGEVKTHTATYTYFGTHSRTIFGLTPHMHMLGTQLRSDRLTKAGGESCVIDVPKWDFHWQQSYRTPAADPVTLESGDSMRLRCTYDNTAAKQPTVDGQKLPPQDVNWGEGTRDEMCLLYTASLRPFTSEHPGACESVRACATAKPYALGKLFGCESQEADCTLCELSAVIACAGPQCQGQLLPMQACIRSCAFSSVLMSSNMGLCLEARCGAEYAAAKACVDAALPTESCAGELGKCGL